MSETNIPEKIEPGDWFLCNGNPLCVLATTTSDVVIAYDPSCLTSSAKTYSQKMLEDPKYGLVFTYMGRGKRKWYWRFLPWRAALCPFTLPRSLWFL